jgi:RNA polymerase sigma-70 factor (ECF subfamily)
MVLYEPKQSDKHAIAGKALSADVAEKLREAAAEYQQALEHIAYRITGDRESARDAVQDVYVQLLTTEFAFAQKSSFKTYLYRIVINKCIDRKRQYARRSLLLKKHQDEPSGEPATNDFDVHVFVRNILGKMPDHFRIPMILAEVDGMSYDEIAHIQKTSSGTIRTRIFRCREKLRKELQKAGYSS